MFNISSDLGSALVSFQKDVQFAEYDIEINLKRAAIDAVVLITHRIQQKGQGSDGQVLTSRAKKRLDAYSEWHGKQRAKRGRQIDHIDFTDRNDLMRSFSVLEITPRLVTAGFLSDAEADIAEYLEAYFGDAFYLADSEMDEVLIALGNAILDDLDRK